jgi:hypothetical protein
MTGIEPATVRSHVLRTGSRSNLDVAPSFQAMNVRSKSEALDSNQQLKGYEPLMGTHPPPMKKQRPTRHWPETLRRAATALRSLRLERQESNLRPPAYKACTPNRQSVAVYRCHSFRRLRLHPRRIPCAHGTALALWMESVTAVESAPCQVRRKWFRRENGQSQRKTGSGQKRESRVRGQEGCVGLSRLVGKPPRL